MKKIISAISILTLLGTASAKDVDEYMTEMKDPSKALKRSIRKDPSSKASLKYAKDLIAASKAFAKFKHKESKFNKLNKDFQKAILSFERAVNAKNSKKIKSTYSKVKSSCSTCHDIYDES